MTQPLSRRTPSECAVDARGIIAFVDGLEAATDVEPHSMMLLRGGDVIAEGWWSPYSQDRVHLLYSLSKSFTSTAVGMAIEEGLFGLHDTVISHFPELDAEITDPRSRSLRIEHLLAMASGHGQDSWDRAVELDPAEPVRGFLLLPPEHDPGTVFAYNQSCTYTLAAIVQKTSGRSLVEFLRPRLFEPLGIGEVGWLSDASGRQLGFSGMFAQTEAIARLGQLYLQRGQWNGRQLLPASWVERATSLQVSTGQEANPDWAQGYGYQFWMARHGYRGDGAYGQFCVVLPEHDAVLALTGQSLNMQTVLDLAWEHLLPAFGSEPDLGSGDGSQADKALAERLSSLALPPLAAGAALPHPGSRVFHAAPGNDQPELTKIALEQDERNSSLRLTLFDGDDRLVVVPGHGSWTVADAVAASAGTVRSTDTASAEPVLAVDVLAVDVLFVETPHRLHLLFDPSTSTFTARWETVPLHELSVNRMRKPANG